MILVKIISVLILVLLTGCAKDVIYTTKYKDVNIPVIVPIDRPNRPIYDKSDTTISYLLKVLEYTETLECIIDNHNKKE